MNNNEMTSRQKQAIQTKKRIYEAALQIMQKHGFENATIEQICKKAKVSVGSFYNYFNSKHDVLSMIYESVDIYYQDVVAPEIENLGLEDQIVTFFSHYARYAVKNGLDFTRHLYSNSENKLFLNRDRFMHQLLHSILLASEEKRKLTPMPLDEIEQFCFILSRGIVNDWCLYDGSYDLEEKMAQSFRLILPLFFKQ